MIVRKVSTPYQFGTKDWLGFEHVTVVPIQTKMVEVSLLSPEEKNWLNQYHAECREKVSPLLSNDRRALEWLLRETQPI